ncbi:hypothetical protein [Mesorhizobium sp. M5C.F.Ca.ET.164.01.1.1]|nr:hypothetical protein [Mesorhizobium sp. M5C.F.Ca.ET.164.01.1.1]TGU01260.1 hypothetical protein EN807_16400 [Mesorhizobium sp. M5C.F.Ca.ET.164.01.1.1]
MPNTYAGAYLKPQGEVTFKSASRLDIVASGQSASAVEALRQRLIAIGDAAAKRISDIEGDALAAAQPAIDRVEAAAMDKLMRSLAQVAV